MQNLVRFLVGGAVVSLFALIGDVLKPKSFAGLSFSGAGDIGSDDCDRRHVACGYRGALNDGGSSRILPLCLVCQLDADALSFQGARCHPGSHNVVCGLIYGAGTWDLSVMRVKIDTSVLAISLGTPPRERAGNFAAAASFRCRRFLTPPATLPRIKKRILNRCLSRCI